MVNKSRKHGKQLRTGITIQLVHGEDDDLITVIREIEEGGRQSTLKKWLRQSQGFVSAKDNEPKPDHAEALSYLMTSMKWIEGQIAGLHPYLEDKFSGFVMRPAGFAPPPPEPAKPGVSQETLDKRMNRLKDRKW